MPEVDDLGIHGHTAHFFLETNGDSESKCAAIGRRSLNGTESAIFPPAWIHWHFNLFKNLNAAV
jgi:hypothetical protein